MNLEKLAAMSQDEKDLAVANFFDVDVEEVKEHPYVMIWEEDEIVNFGTVKWADEAPDGVPTAEDEKDGSLFSSVGWTFFTNRY